MRSRTRWGIAVAVTATLAVLAGLGFSLANATGTSSIDPTIDAALARFQHQQITWHGCRLGSGDGDGQALDAGGAQCADITVPLDYGHPNGRTITVALSRFMATDTAHRIGIMIFNLGGPALPALTEVLAAHQALRDTAARFDLIGMDPRFTNRSSPLDCGLSNDWLLLSAGVDRRSFDRSVRRAKDVADKCVQTHGDELPYTSTANTARDMDVIRAALGEAKLSYLGLSYGSYLGAVYTQLFGPHVDRIVLDSAIDPARPGTLLMVDAGTAREAGLRDWTAWAARHDAQYHLGATPAAVVSVVDRIYQSSAGHPLHVGPYLVDDSVVVGAMFDPLSDDSDTSNDELANIVKVFDQAATTGSAQPAPDPLATRLRGMLTGLDSDKHSARAAIQCADATVTRDPESYWRDIQAHRATEPLFGPYDRNITPCA
ncbi:MAG: alpha/beta fold hydrolase, partial [Mycobacterium sp.]